MWMLGKAGKDFINEMHYKGPGPESPVDDGKGNVEEIILKYIL